MNNDGRSTRMQFDVPGTLAHYVARKGSACIDGVSLTVNEVESLSDGVRFGVKELPGSSDGTALP